MFSLVIGGEMLLLWLIYLTKLSEYQLCIINFISLGWNITYYAKQPEFISSVTNCTWHTHP